MSNNILKFERRKPPQPQRQPRRTPPNYGALIVIALVAVIAWFTSSPFPFGIGNHSAVRSEDSAESLTTVRTGRSDEASRVQSSELHRTTFAMCGSFTHENCVIDGDTFYFRGDKIRVADIDAPETNPPRCEYEARLGDQATEQLLLLLNAGPFTLTPTADGRDQDRYGRKLRLVLRDGASIGAILVARGLARTWTGQRQPWCT